VKLKKVRKKANLVVEMLPLVSIALELVICPVMIYAESALDIIRHFALVQVTIGELNEADSVSFSVRKLSLFFTRMKSPFFYNSNKCS
jgi:hypothetical protein